MPKINREYILEGCNGNFKNKVYQDLENDELFDIIHNVDLISFTNLLDVRRINDIDEYGESLLHCALSDNRYDIALFLIEKGIDVNILSRSKKTALHYICEDTIVYEGQNLSVMIAELLIQHKVDINIQDDFGNNALWVATVNSNYEMVELLIQYNPDIHSKNKVGKSPLDFAIQIEDQYLLKLFTV